MNQATYVAFFIFGGGGGLEARVPGSKSHANSVAKTPAPPAGLSECEGRARRSEPLVQAAHTFNGARITGSHYNPSSNSPQTRRPRRTAAPKRPRLPSISAWLPGNGTAEGGRLTIAVTKPLLLNESVSR